MNQKASPEEVACFRYQCFSQVLNSNRSQQKDWFQKQANMRQQIPGSAETVQVSEHTIRNWMRQYKTQGFKGLYPKNRSDKNKPRVLSQDVQEQIRQILTDYPTLSAVGVYRKLAQAQKPDLVFSDTTVRRYINANNLRSKEKKTQARKKFECASANQLWMVDFMHGIHIPDTSDHNRRKKTYLCAIMDDHSRLIVGANFYFQENTEALMKTFKHSVQRYGIPDRFYCDNGASFSSQYLVKVCARLGAALLHSKPYDSPSRGKIERFFRTVRGDFLAGTNLKAIGSLTQLRNEFQQWLSRSYQETVHNTTCQKPRDRYFQSLEFVSLNRKPEYQIEEDFLASCTRLVHKDRTIKFKSQEFELPAEYVGQKVEVRYPLDDPYDLRLYDADMSFVQKLSIVDPIGNSELPALGIKFNKDKGKNND